MFNARNLSSIPYLKASSRPIFAGLFLLMLAVASFAQEGQDLRQAVDGNYRVLPAQGGVLLVPLGEVDFEVIEIRHGDVAVDGQQVDLAELGAHLGREQASAIRSLAELDSSELLELFDFDSSMEVSALIEEAQIEVEASLDEARIEREALLDEARHDRQERAQQIKEELAEIEETHRAITEELRERSAELREHERERRQDRRRRVSSGESRVVVGSSVVVHEDEEVGEAVAIGGSVTVRGDVSGDAVAIGGTADIDGEVGGGVVSVGGSVRLGNNAEIQGDVVSVGGRIHREPGAVVEGQTTEVNVLSGWLGRWMGGWDWDFDEHRPRSYFDGSIGDLVGSLVFAVLLGIAGLLLILFARARFERAAAYAGAEPVKAGLVGFVVMVMALPVLVVLLIVLAISIVGIPLILLLPFLGLGLCLFSLVGYLAVAYQLGRWSQQRFGWRVLEPVAALVIGLFWLHGWGFLADMIDVFDGPHDFAGFLVILLGLFSFLVKLCGWSVGLGAMLLSSGRTAIPAGTGLLPPVPPAPSSPDASDSFADLALEGDLATPDVPGGDFAAPDVAPPAFDDSLDVEQVVSAVWDEVQEDEVQEEEEQDESSEEPEKELDGIEMAARERAADEPAADASTEDASTADVSDEGESADGEESSRDSGEG